MIISNLIGGLGNQMFQYAVGRAISLERACTFKVDISSFENYGLHQGFELQHIFNCAVDIASEKDVHSILGWQSLPIIKRIVSKPSMLAFRSKTFVIEPHFYYWPEIYSLSSNSYLVGYWQSEQYFAEVATKIREDFTFKLPMNRQNAELAKKISDVNAVSLHVRRGDYVNNKKNAVIYHLCSLDYYQAAILHIASQVASPHFYIFSDDIAWVKSNLSIDFSHEYVDHNEGAESYNDMRLMALCKHNIIANSSFSWWGAWLNPSEDKIVIAPKRWFNNETDVSDLIPNEWITL